MNELSPDILILWERVDYKYFKKNMYKVRHITYDIMFMMFL